MSCTARRNCKAAGAPAAGPPCRQRKRLVAGEDEGEEEEEEEEEDEVVAPPEAMWVCFSADVCGGSGRAFQGHVGRGNLGGCIYRDRGTCQCKLHKVLSP